MMRSPLNTMIEKQSRKTTTFPFPLHLLPTNLSTYPKPSPHLPQDFPQVLRQAGPHLLYDLFGDLLVVGFGEAAGDAGEGIAVAAEPVGHRKTHNGIISEFTSLRKQREIGGLDVVEFVYESYKIKGDNSEK